MYPKEFNNKKPMSDMVSYFFTWYTENHVTFIREISLLGHLLAGNILSH